MNIEEYRAMKAQIEQEDSITKEQPTNAQTQSTADADVQTPSQEDTKGDSVSGAKDKPTQTSEGKEQGKQVDTPTVPQTIEIDGKEVPVDELKNGYLRQSDYTKKTQELARQREETKQAIELFEQIRKNPELAEQLSQTTNNPNLDPAQQRIAELENKYYDLMLEREIEQLQGKYEDFEVREVLQVAHDKGLNNLEDAYHLAKSTKQQVQPKAESLDLNSIKEQIRQELLNELKQAPNADTSTIIQSGGDTAPVRDDSPKLSEAEIRVALNMGMKPEEYAKWRNKK